MKLSEKIKPCVVSIVVLLAITAAEAEPTRFQFRNMNLSFVSSSSISDETIIGIANSENVLNTQSLYFPELSAKCDINFTGANFRLCNILPTIPFADYANPESLCDRIRKNASIKTGAVLSFDQLFNIPLRVWTGNLSFTGGISRLGNPAISTSINPFRFSFGTTANLSTILPSSGSTKNPFAGKIEYSWTAESTEKQIHVDRIIIESAYKTDGTVLSSITASGSTKKTNLTITVTGGRFFLAKKNNTLWYQAHIPFPEDWYYAGLVRILVVSPFFCSQLWGGAQESPFGTYRFWARTENSTKMGNLSFKASLFATDSFFNLYTPQWETGTQSALEKMTNEAILCANNTYLTETAQALFSQQYTQKLKGKSDCKLRIGSTALLTLSKSQYEAAYGLSGRYAVGINCNFRQSTITTTATAIGLPPYTSIKISDSKKTLATVVSYGFGTQNTTAECSATCRWKYSNFRTYSAQKFRATVSGKGKMHLQLTTTISTDINNKKINVKSVDTALSVKKTYENCKITFKFKLAVPF